MMKHLSAKYKNNMDFGGVSAFFFQNHMFFDVPAAVPFSFISKRQ